MTIFVRLGGGRQIYAELARWTRPDSLDPWFEVRREPERWWLWFGRLMVIYTPARQGAAGPTGLTGGGVAGHERAGTTPRFGLRGLGGVTPAPPTPMPIRRRSIG